MPDERALAFIHELEQADEAVAATLSELDELTRAVGAVQAEALELEAALALLPSRRVEATASAEAALRDVEERRAAHEGAAAALAEAERKSDRDRTAAARRAEVRARDLLATAQRRLDAFRADEARLSAEEESAQRRSTEVEERTRALARVLGLRPGLGEAAGTEPEGGLEGVSRWATEARAALLVARGGLAAQREAVIRQANELGSVVLGEPLTARSPAAVARLLAGRPS